MVSDRGCPNGLSIANSDKDNISVCEPATQDTTTETTSKTPLTIPSATIAPSTNGEEKKELTSSSASLTWINKWIIALVLIYLP